MNRLASEEQNPRLFWSGREWFGREENRAYLFQSGVRVRRMDSFTIYLHTHSIGIGARSTYGGARADSRARLLAAVAAGAATTLAQGLIEGGGTACATARRGARGSRLADFLSPPSPGASATTANPLHLGPTSPSPPNSHHWTSFFRCR